MEWKRASLTDENTNTYSISDRWVFLHYYEAFNLLFRIENALRVFVYLVLKNQHAEKWADIQISSEEDGNEGTISSIAKRRMTQSQSYEYLGELVTCPIMHLLISA